MHVTLRLTTTATMRMVTCKLSVAYPNKRCTFFTYMRSWPDHELLASFLANVTDQLYPKT
jgi:hypothetical protein